MNADPNERKVAEIVNALLQRTTERQVRWKRSDEQDAYLYATPSSSIVVRRLGPAGMGGYQLRILDGRGQVVDELASQHGIVGLATASMEQMQAASSLERLWAAARDSAATPNPLLDTILREVRGY